MQGCDSVINNHSVIQIPSELVGGDFFCPGFEVIVELVIHTGNICGFKKKKLNYNHLHRMNFIFSLKTGRMRKLLLLTITAFFLFSFITTNGQNPTVTINQSAAQPDPANSQPINFTVVFDQPVIGFTIGDVVITGTASAGVAHVVTGGPTTYYVAVAGMISCGTIIANIPAGVCTNALLQPNLASTSLDNTVTYLTVNPNVTINQAASQPDPTNQSPINFTVQFDQLVTGFATGDVTLTGTAGATTAIVTGSGNYYNVAVSGMTASGTVIATIAAGVSQNACTQPNNASTSTDNTVTISCVPPVVNVTPSTSCVGVSGCLGPLTASGNADIYIWSPLAGLFVDCNATIPYTGDNRTVVYAVTTVNTIYTVTGTKLATGCTNTASAKVFYTPPAPVVTPPSVNMCLGDAAVKLKVTTGGIPTTPAIWSPAAGLFADPASTIPYVAGTQVDSVWVRPTPAGVYPYQVTTQGVPVLLCSPATNFVSNNGDGMVTFNVKNNHAFPIRLLQINSKTLTAAQTVVSVYYKASAINGPPGFISAANGWNQFGGAGIIGTGTGIQPFLTNLQLTIPPGVTYGICLRAITFTSVPNLAFRTLSSGNYSFNDGGCELITGTNIGYSGNTNTPATPLSGFVGSVQFADATNCTSPSRTVVVSVGQVTTVTVQPVNRTVCVGNTAIYTVGVAGVGPFTYQWQVSTNAGTTYNNIVNGGVFNGALTNTLFVTPSTITMNGNLFRVLINGGSGCTGATSAAALLTVNPLPNIVLTANPLIIGPTQTTTIFSTVTPNPAATYTWYYNNLVLLGAVSSSLLVSYGSPGDYQLRITDVNGCANFSNIITIANSFALNMFTYPNPSGGIFQVRYHSEPNNTLQRTLTVYNNRGEKIIIRNFTQTIPYQKIDIDVRANGKGLYWVEVRDANGKRLGIKRVVVH